MNRTISAKQWSGLLALATPLLSAACLAQSPIFSLQVLGNISGGTGAGAYAINNLGEAVGSAGGGTSVCPTGCAVIWTDTTPTILGSVAGATTSNAYSLNNAGQVVGFVNMSGYQQAVIWINGTPSLLQSPSSQYVQTIPASINDSGQVAGQASGAQGVTAVAVVWNGTTPTALDSLPGCTGGASAGGINSNGLVAGDIGCGTTGSHLEPVVWHGTTATRLPMVKLKNGVPSGIALAVNNFGLVVGTANNPSALAYATAWQGGTVTNLGVLGTGLRSVATALNDRGIIVGQSATSGYDVFHATLWSRVGAATQDLNALISAAQAAEYELTDATGINDSCAIVANGYNKKTRATMAFLLTLIDSSNCVNGM